MKPEDSPITVFGLEAALCEAIRQVLEQAGMQVDSLGLHPSAVNWEMPKDPSFGDLSNSIAFKLAALRKQPPMQIAEELAKSLYAFSQTQGWGTLIARVESKSGYINAFFSPAALAQALEVVLTRRESFGIKPPQAGCSINIEFVSANPTGPLSVAHGRQAAVGDALVRLLRSQGQKVTAEYYLNDEGRQVEMLGRSLRARYAGLLGSSDPFPEDGYQGEYVTDHAKALREKHGDGLLEKPLEWFMQAAMEEQMGRIKADLAQFGLTFDRWTSQRWLNTSGKIDQALETLRKQGALYKAEDAEWFASSKFGDDKDRVVRKRDGEMTYLAPDIAYHQWKFEQGYNQLLNLWGPDHHGYIPRMKAAVKALGLDANQFTVKIVQLVTLTRDGKEVPMSKRQGEFVTFREILDEVGVDATRFFYLCRTMESHLDFDLDLAKSQSQENPVYYIQYAHARICSIWSKLSATAVQEKPDLSRLIEPEEQHLIRVLFQYPIVLRLSANALEPQGVTVYLRKLAESFHVFYTKHRVITENGPLTAARLALILAAAQVLANGLSLLGISAPKKM